MEIVNNSKLSFGNSDRFKSIDIYKGVAILFVILTHFNWSNLQRLYMGFPFWVDMAVPIFMIISGYLYAYIYHEKTIKTIYTFKNLLAKWVRFLIPFTVIFALELIIKIYIGEKITLISLFLDYICGGEGPGSYYTPIMLQFVLAIPLIVKLIEKNSKLGLGICFFINLAFEIVKWQISLDVEIYRLLIFRYLFVISYGVFLFFDKGNKVKLFHLFCTCVGLAYIIVFCYLGKAPIVTNMWTGTSMFASMFIFLIMKWLISFKNISSKVFESFGKASYDIFLVQMLYYWPIDNLVNSYIKNGLIQLLSAFIFSLCVGIAFYKIENPITRNIIKIIRN